MSQHTFELLTVIGVILLLIICHANWLTRNIKIACSKCGKEMSKEEEDAHEGVCCDCTHGAGGIDESTRPTL